MAHPFQCIHAFRNPDAAGAPLLLAAAGPRIYTYDMLQGTRMSTWCSDRRLKVSQRDVQDGDLTGKEPSGKRRRLSAAANEPRKSTSSLPDGPPAIDVKSPSIIKLTTTYDGRHAIAVSGDDKCIRVFQIVDKGRLKLLSERCMPKRPCAIAITWDDSTILSADKFGDVYAIPLILSSAPMSKQADPAKLSKPKTRFIPTADERTVHTKGNKQALRNQLLEANQPTEKEPLPFDHQLLLGHVSMLTDLVIVPKFPEHNSAPSSGSYIITADRDEHIRITRGMPQAHIIEGYCLGHSQLVSRLCLPVRLPRLLISGGGDDYLALWDWKAGKIRQKLDLRPALTAYMAIEGVRPLLSPAIEPRETKASQEAADDARDAKPDTKTTPKVAVSGIWQIASTFDYDGEQDTATDIVVALEGIPALFMLQLSAKGDLSFRQTLPLQGNPLDIAVHPSKASFIVSIDNIHDARSTTEPRSEPGKTLIQAYSAATAPRGGSGWQEDVDSAATWLEIIDQAASPLDLTQLRSLRELLYDVEKIRKRPGSED